MTIDYSASALGLVSEMPSGPGVISEELISKIANAVPPGISTFLLTSKQNADEIIDQHKRCRTNTIQLCDRIETKVHQKLKATLPGIKIVQVIHVADENSFHEAVEVSRYVDAILLDSGNQKLEVKELGGTGRTHDWQISRKIRESIQVPMFLAGGLNSNNVAGAITQVNPFGVDVCSGVRTNGKLDEQKLKSFFEQIRKADRIN
ncbi:MAG: phosphoribosylanthranilate isomerase [Bacteroidetes bacterium]|nr:phosphoribosylanthranilate isomerase [Bacteroidota bacterium]